MSPCRTRRRRAAGPCCCRHRSWTGALAESENAPPESRRGTVTVTPCWLRSLQSSDVVHDLPALLLRQVLPGWHGATAVRDLPEELTVGFLLDRRRRPVRGLRRRQRGGGRAVAFSHGAVTRHAVRLDSLLRVPDALHRVLHGLGVGRRYPWSLGGDHRHADPDDERDRDDGDAQRPPERAHGASSRETRTIVMMFTQRDPFNTPGTNEVKQIFDARASRRANRARPDPRRRRRGAPASARARPTARRARRWPGASGSRRRAWRGSRPRRRARRAPIGGR